MKPGSGAKRDSEHGLCGTANVFCGVEPKAGQHFTKVTPTRSSPQFANFLRGIADYYPQAENDPSGDGQSEYAHPEGAGGSVGEKEGGLVWDRFTVHYTPKHGSWLKQAEIEISLFSRACLGKRRIPDIGTMRREARAWNRGMNRRRVKIN